MSDELTAAERLGLEQEEAQFLHDLGCRCPNSNAGADEFVGDGECCYSVSAHYNDCPAVAFFSRPENHPPGCDCGEHDEDGDPEQKADEE